MFSAFGYDVIMTRDSDKSIYDSGIKGTGEQKLSDMKNRLEILNSKSNAICLSIHQNQFAEPQYSGAQIFYSAHLMANTELDQTVQDTFKEMLQPENDREIKECGDSLYLCCNCKNPMVMVECGFLSNPDEAKLLDTEDYQKKVAFTILYSVLSYDLKK